MIWKAAWNGHVATVYYWDASAIEQKKYVGGSLCSLMTSYGDRSGSTLAQVMGFRLTAPSHYLDRCWRIIYHSINLIAISWELFVKLIYITCFKSIHLKNATITPTGDATAVFVFQKSTEMYCFHRHKRYNHNNSKEMGLIHRRRQRGNRNSLFFTWWQCICQETTFSILCIYEEI